MKTGNYSIIYGLLGTALVAVLLIVASALASTTTHSGATSSNGKAASNAQPNGTVLPVNKAPAGTGSFKYGSPNLNGATDAQFAEFAADWARHRLKPKGAPEVLFARSVTYGEIPILGLGCPPNYDTIEEPPLMMAILRGEFDVREAGPGFTRAAPPVAGKESYVVYIFDVWAGRPAITIVSQDGAVVKRALNDPNLPELDVQLPSTCPTPIPSSQRTRHYGEEAPGFIVPPHPTLPIRQAENTPMPASTAMPVGTIVPIERTPDIPAPVPTVTDQ